MSDNRYDIIIIGTGAGGGTLAHRLAPSGKRILLLERGDYVPREKANWDSHAVVAESRYRIKEAWRDKDGREFHAGAHYNVRITSLRAADGPGIEFLEYLAPRDGRPFPADERANDLVHCQTRLVASDGRSLEKLRQSLPVAVSGHQLGFARGVMVRDPDGHALEIVEP